MFLCVSVSLCLTHLFFLSFSAQYFFTFVSSTFASYFQVQSILASNPGMSCTTNLTMYDGVGSSQSTSGTFCDHCCSTCLELNDPCPRLLQRLERLHLEGNLISIIPPNSLRGLVSLKELFLDYNYISSSSLSDDTSSSEYSSFSGLENVLEILSLSNCQLGPTLSSNIFKSLRSLRSLDISANSLRSVTKDVFQGLENLQILNLALNRILDLESLDVFQDLTNLRELDLSNNLIKRVSLVSFLSVSSLERLNLDSNQIEDMSIFDTSSTSTSRRRRRLSSTYSLRQLSVRKNRITVINPAVTMLLCASNPTFDLIMEGNPSVCTCTSGCSCEFFTQVDGLGTQQRNLVSLFLFPLSLDFPYIHQLSCVSLAGCKALHDATLRTECASSTSGCVSSYSLFSSSLRNCVNTDTQGDFVSTEGGDFLRIENANVSLQEGSLRLVLYGDSSSSDVQNTCTQDGPTTFKCQIPEGVGRARDIALLSSMDIRTGILQSCVLDFARPVIDSVTSSFYSTSHGAPREGNVSITVRGSNFGLQDALVFVNGDECTNLIHSVERSHREVICTLPPLRVFQRTNTFILFQSNQFSSFDSFYYTTCPSNYIQHRKDESMHYECFECARGKFSTGPDAYVCEACSWPYYFSEHCEFPVMGIMSACFLSVVLTVSLVLFIKSLAEQKKIVKTQENKLLAQKTELANRLHEIDMLSSAWVTSWDEVNLEEMIARGSEGMFSISLLLYRHSHTTLFHLQDPCGKLDSEDDSALQ